MISSACSQPPEPVDPEAMALFPKSSEARAVTTRTDLWVRYRAGGRDFRGSQLAQVDLSRVDLGGSISAALI